jgi:beta-N-acetylhexosaminidase
MVEPLVMPLGPLMVDVEALELGRADLQRLLHPLAGGVILFARNYESPEQLAQLTRRIHALRSPALIIAVDHEGGRVQRFRRGFTALPAMRELGGRWDENPHQAKKLAQDVGFILAAELRAHGVDLSFAPVLDVDHGSSTVIGDRAFHGNPFAVADLARALIHGLKEAGMSAVGKHFPGHGAVRADSHLEVPVDERPYAQIEECDLVPFARLAAAGLGGVMPAHVIYPAVDRMPAGFSSIWLKTILRERLGFDGVVFSDDLSMEGASVAGGIVERVTAALDAGCDMALVCNNPSGVDELCRSFSRKVPPVALARLARVHGRPEAPSLVGLREDARYGDALRSISGLGHDTGDLPLA